MRDNERYEQLERLGALKESGVLSDEEFAREKEKLLSGNTRFASQGEQETPTWAQFIASEVAASALAANTEGYRKKFAKILEKADVSELKITDTEAISRIRWTSSINWAAFFAGGFWASYRGVKFWVETNVLIATIFFTQGCFAAFTNIDKEGLRATSGFLTLAVLLTLVRFGDAWLLLSIAEVGKPLERKCPSLSRVGILLLALVGTLILLGLVISEKQVSQTSSSAPTDTRQTVQIGARELSAAYNTNEVAAQNRFGNSIIEVTGQVESITLDFLDRPVVMLDSGEFLPVMTIFGKEHSSKVAQLSQRETVTIECQRISEVISAPVLEGCGLVP